MVQWLVSLVYHHEMGMVHATTALELSRKVAGSIIHSLLPSRRIFGPLDQSRDLRLVDRVVGRHIPMLSLSIFRVVSKCCMGARLCSILIVTVFDDRLVFCQHNALT